MNLAYYLSTSWYSIVLLGCRVGHRAFLCDVHSLLDYTLGIEAHAHSVLLSFKTIYITLLPLLRPGGISQRILQLISLNCSFPHIAGLLSSLGKKKKSSYVIMHFCPFYNLFIQTSRLLLLFKVNFLEFYSMFRSCQSVKAMVLKIYIYAINFKIAT